jgi:hypothetical protein
MMYAARILLVLFGLALVGAAFFLNALPSAGPRPGLVVAGGALILAALTFL